MVIKAPEPESFSACWYPLSASARVNGSVALLSANVDVRATAVYTNNPPCGAMRGFGVNQAAFALEGALDQTLFERGPRSVTLTPAGRAFLPVVDRSFSFDEAGAAHRHIQDRKNFGKVVLRP